VHAVCACADSTGVAGQSGIASSEIGLQQPGTTRLNDVCPTMLTATKHAADHTFRNPHHLEYASTLALAHSYMHVAACARCCSRYTCCTPPRYITRLTHTTIPHSSVHMSQLPPHPAVWSFKHERCADELTDLLHLQLLVQLPAIPSIHPLAALEVKPEGTITAGHTHSLSAQAAG
jgi:hypothetical protein